MSFQDTQEIRRCDDLVVYLSGSDVPAVSTLEGRLGVASIAFLVLGGGPPLKEGFTADLFPRT